MEGAGTPWLPVTRATVVRADPLGSEDDAQAWLARLRRDREARDGEVAEAVEELNRLVRAHRAAARDPYVRDIEARKALAIRVGHAAGERAADGRLDAAIDGAPRAPRMGRAERLSPQERVAEVLGGHAEELAADELVLRARADLAAARPREAALQARIALECVLEELDPARVGDLVPALEQDREHVSAAAAAALHGDPPQGAHERVEQAVARMERALRRHRDRAR